MTYETLRLTHGASCRLLRTPSGATVIQPACAAGRAHAHVAIEQVRQAAEHLLLGDRALAGEQLAQAVGEILVVRHAYGEPLTA